MRSEFIEGGTLPQAWSIAPWACKIIEVEGGFHAFESVTDYDTWMNTNKVDILVGDRVEGGDIEEDYDIGTVEKIEGDFATVRWEQNPVVTFHKIDCLRKVN